MSGGDVQGTDRPSGETALAASNLATGGSVESGSNGASDRRGDPYPAPRFFLPRIDQTIVGLLLVVVAVSVPIILGAEANVVLISLLASTFLVGTILCLTGIVRWDQAGRFYDYQRSESAKWYSRWRELRAQTQQTTIVLSNLTDGVILISPETKILLINQSARSMLALSEVDVYLGRKFAEIVRIPELVELVRQATKQIAQKEFTPLPAPDSYDELKSVSVEIVSGTSVRPVSVRADRITDSPESNVTLVIRDETEAKRVEAIRREFIANVSHELKTPLAAIKGYAETVEIAIDDDPDAAKHFVTQINGQCLRLEQLVADMMELARAQSDEENLSVGIVVLDEIISRSLSSFRPIANARGVNLETEMSSGRAKVISDPEATLTIAHNLISNAIRHTPKGGNVKVSCRRQDEFWALVVSDDGEGIDASDQERVFERFYRASKNRHPGFGGTELGGTGLGLSIVKNLTRALGGNVRLTSSLGHGATFEVLLRAADNVESE